MAPQTTKKKIQDCLENLSAIEFKKFCHALVDRKIKPRIATSMVEGKDFLDVTNVIVSTYGETKALDVFIKVLKGIGCRNHADALEPKTRPKVSVGNGDPALPKTSSRALKTKPSLKIAADQKQAKATGNGEPKTRPKVSVGNGGPALPKTSLKTKPSLKIVADQKQAKATGRTGLVKKPKAEKADEEI